jgi:hypothetical protein
MNLIGMAHAGIPLARPDQDVRPPSPGKKTPGLFAKLALSAASLLILFLIMELISRQIWFAPPEWKRPQTLVIKSPLLGWVPEPNSTSYTIDALVTINAHGLRDREFPPQKPTGELRVLCLGDSFTFGMGVEQDDTYVEQLERRLRSHYTQQSIQAINAGVGGYETRRELLYLLAAGLDFEPDLITVGFYWNDLKGNDRPLPDLKTTPRIPDRFERLQMFSEHFLPPAIRDRLRRSVFFYQVGLRINRLVTPSKDPVGTKILRALLTNDQEFLGPYWKQTERSLLAIENAARKKGIPVLLVVFPTEEQLHMDPGSLHHGELLHAIWEPTGMPCVDLDEAYRSALQSGENPYMPYDQHPNELGMRIAAEAIHAEIVSRNLLD